MRLQINASGSWRDVGEFPDARLDAVKTATVLLAGILTSPRYYRIIASAKGGSPKVVAYLDPPFTAWSKA